MADDYTEDFLQDRETAEFQGSALSRLMSTTREEFAQKRGEEPDVPIREMTEEQRLAIHGGTPDKPLEEPFIDPISAATGGAVGKTLLVKGGSPILKALSGGALGAAAEFPIGTAAEIVEEKAPGTGLPFSVAAGMISGATIESSIEEGVKKFLIKKGGGVTDELVEATKKTVVKNLEAGQTDEATDLVTKIIDKKVKPIEDTAETAIAATLGAEKSPSFTIVPRKEAEEFLEIPKEQLADKAVNINLNRINSEEDVKQVIQKIASKVDAPKVQTNAETQKLASSMGMTMDELLLRREGQAFNAQEALASRQFLTSSAEKVADLARKASGPNAGKVDEIAFRKALTLHKAIQDQVTGITSEAGRALQQFNIMGMSTKGKLKQIDAIIAGTAGSEISIKDIANAVSGMGTVEEINRFLPKAFKATTADVLQEAWINGLLSGPQTHVVNMLSNSLVAAWQIPERFLAAGFTKAIGSGEEAIQFGEAGAQLYGLVRGVEDGFRAGFRHLKGEDIGSDLLTKLEVRHQSAISSEALGLSGGTGRAVDMLGKAVRLPGAALNLEDTFFKSVGYRMELQARAYRTASAEGLSGDAFSARVTSIVNNPPEDIHMASIDAARYQTFTNELTGPGRDVQKFSNKYPLAKVVIPFVRTPANIAKFAIERTPLAPFMKEVRADIKAGGSRRDLALAKISLGSTTMAMVSTWAAEGKITGGGPVKGPKRSALYQTGWQPYSILIGDKYYSYGRLEPIGTLFGLAADYADISGQIDEMDAGELTSAIVVSAAKNVTSKTFLSGISDAVEAFSDPERYGERYIQRLAGSVVPTGIAQFTRVQDPVLRETESILDTIKSRVPGYSETLPARKNIFAEEITLSGGLGPDIMSPIYTSSKKQDAISKEIEANEIPITMPSDVVSGIELSVEQYDNLLGFVANGDEELGIPPLKSAWEELIKTREYQRSTTGENGGRSLLTRNLINTYKSIGSAKLVESDAKLRAAIEEKQRELPSKFGL